MPDLHAPRLGEPGEPCRNCGAALADDQRYCLECGTRRGDPRVALRAPAPPTASGPVLTGAAAPAGVAVLRGNQALIASIGCLLLAMGVGVLIGRSGDSAKPQAAAAPQIIRVAGGAAATTTADTSASTGSTTAKKSTKSKKSSKDSVPTAASAKDSKATNPTLKSLDKLSPAQYQKKAAKLPKTVGTGGKAPPKDNKAPAGGGGFEAIG